MNTTDRLEWVAAGALMASIALVSFNLLTAQVLFGVAALAWLYLAIAHPRPVDLPRFAWALGAYAALTVVSALVSFASGIAVAENRETLPSSWLDRWASVIDLKQLVLFLMVPMVMRLLSGPLAMRTLNVVIAVGAAAALLGVVEYAMFGFDHLGNRPLGSLTHYMTYSGVIMLVLSASVARLLFYPQQIIWPAVAVPALTVALAVTQTRGAWVGALVAVASLVAAKRPKLLWLAPVLIALAFVVAPASIKNRALSIFDSQNESNRDRIQMQAMGAAMVRDHPWFGVGPEMVGRMYGRYLQPNPVHTYNPHLHNVPVQIAAERGLPALAAWLAFIGLAVAGLLGLLRHGSAPAMAAAGLAATLAMLSAGLFEYNFGDSEFLMLFLGLITLPFAARVDGGGKASATRVAQP